MLLLELLPLLQYSTVSWIPFSFLPDDPELWDISLEGTELKVTGGKPSEPSGAAQQGTPRGHQHRSTRSRTPHRGPQHRAAARLAQLQGPAAAPSTSCAHQHPPGTAATSLGLLGRGEPPLGQTFLSFLLDLALNAGMVVLGNCFSPSCCPIKEGLEKELRNTFRGRKKMFISHFLPVWQGAAPSGEVRA